MDTWDVLKDSVKISEDIVDNYRTMFESRISAGRAQKTSIPSKSSYFFVILWYGRSCKEMCGAILWVSPTRRLQQLYIVSTPCIDDHHFKEEEIEIRGRIVKSMLSNCSEMLIHGTCWKTRYSRVSEQTCTIDLKKPGSFLNRVSDRLRKMLDRFPEDWMQDIEKTLYDLGNVFVFDIGSICIHGKELLWQFYIPSEIQSKNLTLKQMFEISEQLILEQSDEIFGVCLVNDEEVISLSHATVDILSDSVLCLGRVNQNPTSIFCLGRTVELVSKIYQNTELWTQWTENRWNSSGIFSQDSQHCSSSTKSKSSWTKCATQRNSKDELSQCRCSMTSYGDLKTMNGNAMRTQTLVSTFAKSFPAGRWSFLGPGSEKNWYSTYIERPRRRMGQSRWIDDDKNSEKADTQFFRATSPLSRGTLKSKGGGNLSIHFCADGDTMEAVFSHNYFC